MLFPVCKLTALLTKNPSYIIYTGDRKLALPRVGQVVIQGDISSRGNAIPEGGSKTSALLAPDGDVVNRDFVVVSNSDVAVVSSHRCSI
jgi:hypothetical protein